MNHINLPLHLVHQDITLLVRTFPSERLRFVRRVIGGVTTYGQVQRVDGQVIYDGEALFVPAAGNVTRYGLGQVEEDQPQCLISGSYDIRQGDFVERKGRLYVVEYPPDFWHAFLLVTLKQYQQSAPVRK